MTIFWFCTVFHKWRQSNNISVTTFQPLPCMLQELEVLISFSRSCEYPAEKSGNHDPVEIQSHRADAARIRHVFLPASARTCHPCIRQKVQLALLCLP